MLSMSQMIRATKKTSEEDIKKELLALASTPVDTIPDLSGTERQIAWAEDIRKAFREGSAYQRWQKIREEVKAGTYSDFDIRFFRSGLTILTSEKASKIIDSRFIVK